MKRLVSVVVLLLASALQAAEIGKPAAPLGVELPAAPLSVVTSLPPGQAPAVSLSALPAVPAAANDPSHSGPAALPAAPVQPAIPALPAAAAAPRQGAGAPAEAPSAKPTALEQVRAIRGRLEAQLKDMEGVLGGSDPVLAQVRAEADHSLSRIEDHVAHGRIDPTLSIRTHEDHPEVAPHRRPRIGVYPVAADPFQWAHLLIGLRAMAEFQLDKIVYVLAGDDPRKPNMTPVVHRHPMGQAVLDTFAPLFAYSPIAVGTTHDGETNIFRMLALNTEHEVHAFYLVGGDHYQRQTPSGSDDTIAKLEKKLPDASLGHDPEKHDVSVAFIARGDENQGSVPTTLDIHFLNSIPFEASSTLVRKGQLALMPHAAYQWVLDHLPGHYGIKKPQ